MKIYIQFKEIIILQKIISIHFYFTAVLDYSIIKTLFEVKFYKIPNYQISVTSFNSTYLTIAGILQVNFSWTLAWGTEKKYIDKLS